MFSTEDGDIILRTQGSPPCDFRVHSLLLSLASPVFKDMFKIPQPPPVVPKLDVEPEVIYVTDPPHALDLVLRFIYPFPSPDIDSLDQLFDGLVIADKYDIIGARADLRLRLTKFIEENPLRVYAIASKFGFEEEAEAVSPLTTKIYLPSLADLPDDLKDISAMAYHRLIKIHENCRDEIEDIIDGVLFEGYCHDCNLTRALVEASMRTKLVRIICRGGGTNATAYFQELGIRCGAGCMRRFVENVAVKLEAWE